MASGLFSDQPPSHEQGHVPGHGLSSQSLTIRHQNRPADLCKRGPADHRLPPPCGGTLSHRLQTLLLVAGYRSAAQAPSPLFAFVVVSNNGLARLNLSTGGIQFCQLSDTNGRPTSRCVKVGSFPTDNLASAQMRSVPGHVVIPNAATGVMVDCAVVINTNFIAGVPSGSCMALT